MFQKIDGLLEPRIPKPTDELTPLTSWVQSVAANHKALHSNQSYLQDGSHTSQLDGHPAQAGGLTQKRQSLKRCSISAFGDGCSSYSPLRPITKKRQTCDGVAVDATTMTHPSSLLSAEPFQVAQCLPVHKAFSTLPPNLPSKDITMVKMDQGPPHSQTSLTSDECDSIPITHPVKVRSTLGTQKPNSSDIKRGDQTHSALESESLSEVVSAINLWEWGLQNRDKESYMIPKMSIMVDRVKKLAISESFHSVLTATSTRDGTPLDGIRNRMAGWLCYVQRKTFDPLSHHTFLQAANLFDRFLFVNHRQPSSEKARGRKLQFRTKLDEIAAEESNLSSIAIGCLLIASKCEDQRYMHMEDALIHAGRVGKGDEVVKWEKEILETVGWNINVPTALDFLQFYLESEPAYRRTPPRVSPESPPPVSIGLTAHFIIDQATLEAQTAMLLPHLLAAAALLLAVGYTTNKKRGLHHLPQTVLEFVNASTPSANGLNNPELLNTAVLLATYIENFLKCENTQNEDHRYRTAGAKHREAYNHLKHQVTLWQEWRSRQSA